METNACLRYIHKRNGKEHGNCFRISVYPVGEWQRTWKPLYDCGFSVSGLGMVLFCSLIYSDLRSQGSRIISRLIMGKKMETIMIFRV